MKTEQNLDQKLTVKQTADLLSVSELTVRRLIKLDLIGSYRIGTGNRRPGIRLSIAQVSDYLASVEKLPMCLLKRFRS